MKTPETNKWIAINKDIKYFGVKSETVREWIKKIRVYLLRKLEDDGSSNSLNWVYELRLATVPYDKIGEKA